MLKGAKDCLSDMRDVSREPDQYRYDIEEPRLDSFSGRVSWNPIRELSLQVSYGHLHSPEALEPAVRRSDKTAAFNMTILSHLLGTPYQPDFDGHVLMLEEVSEAMYRIDRSLFHITSNPGIRRVAGIMLGRCINITANEPDFGMNEEEVARTWCDKSGIPWLGRADIGHDADNKIVPFGIST